MWIEETNLSAETLPFLLSLKFHSSCPCVFQFFRRKKGHLFHSSHTTPYPLMKGAIPMMSWSWRTISFSWTFPLCFTKMCPTYKAAKIVLHKLKFLPEKIRFGFWLSQNENKMTSWLASVPKNLRENAMLVRPEIRCFFGITSFNKVPVPTSSQMFYSTCKPYKRQRLANMCRNNTVGLFTSTRKPE